MIRIPARRLLVALYCFITWQLASGAVEYRDVHYLVVPSTLTLSETEALESPLSAAAVEYQPSVVSSSGLPSRIPFFHSHLWRGIGASSSDPASSVLLPRLREPTIDVFGGGLDVRIVVFPSSGILNVTANLTSALYLRPNDSSNGIGMVRFVWSVNVAPRITQIRPRTGRVSAILTDDGTIRILQAWDSAMTLWYAVGSVVEGDSAAEPFPLAAGVFSLSANRPAGAFFPSALFDGAFSSILLTPLSDLVWCPEDCGGPFGGTCVATNATATSAAGGSSEGLPHVCACVRPRTGASCSAASQNSDHGLVPSVGSGVTFLAQYYQSIQISPSNGSSPSWTRADSRVQSHPSTLLMSDSLFSCSFKGSADYSSAVWNDQGNPMYAYRGGYFVPQLISRFETGPRVGLLNVNHTSAVPLFTRGLTALGWPTSGDRSVVLTYTATTFLINTLSPEVRTALEGGSANVTRIATASVPPVDGVGLFGVSSIVDSTGPVVSVVMNLQMQLADSGALVVRISNVKLPSSVESLPVALGSTFGVGTLTALVVVNLTNNINMAVLLEAPTPEPCSAVATNCSACIANSKCFWCASTGTCGAKSLWDITCPAADVYSSLSRCAGWQDDVKDHNLHYAMRYSPTAELYPSDTEVTAGTFSLTYSTVTSIHTLTPVMLPSRSFSFLVDPRVAARVTLDTPPVMIYGAEIAGLMISMYGIIAVPVAKEAALAQCARPIWSDELPSHCANIGTVISAGELPLTAVPRYNVSVLPASSSECHVLDHLIVHNRSTVIAPASNCVFIVVQWTGLHFQENAAEPTTVPHCNSQTVQITIVATDRGTAVAISSGNLKLNSGCTSPWLSSPPPSPPAEVLPYLQQKSDRTQPGVPSPFSGPLPIGTTWAPDLTSSFVGIRPMYTSMVTAPGLIPLVLLARGGTFGFSTLPAATACGACSSSLVAEQFRSILSQVSQFLSGYRDEDLYNLTFSTILLSTYGGRCNQAAGVCQCGSTTAGSTCAICIGNSFGRYSSVAKSGISIPLVGQPNLSKNVFVNPFLPSIGLLQEYKPGVCSICQSCGTGGTCSSGPLNRGECICSSDRSGAKCELHCDSSTSHYGVDARAEPSAGITVDPCHSHSVCNYGTCECGICICQDNWGGSYCNISLTLTQRILAAPSHTGRKVVPVTYTAQDGDTTTIRYWKDLFINLSACTFDAASSSSACVNGPEPDATWRGPWKTLSEATNSDDQPFSPLTVTRNTTNGSIDLLFTVDRFFHLRDTPLFVSPNGFLSPSIHPVCQDFCSVIGNAKAPMLASLCADLYPAKQGNTTGRVMSREVTRPGASSTSLTGSVYPGSPNDSIIVVWWNVSFYNESLPTTTINVGIEVFRSGRFRTFHSDPFLHHLGMSAFSGAVYSEHLRTVSSHTTQAMEYYPFEDPCTIYSSCRSCVIGAPIFGAPRPTNLNDASRCVWCRATSTCIARSVADSMCSRFVDRFSVIGSELGTREAPRCYGDHSGFITNSLGLGYKYQAVVKHFGSGIGGLPSLHANTPYLNSQGDDVNDYSSLLPADAEYAQLVSSSLAAGASNWVESGDESVLFSFYMKQLGLLGVDESIVGNWSFPLAFNPPSLDPLINPLSARHLRRYLFAGTGTTGLTRDVAFLGPLGNIFSFNLSNSPLRQLNIIAVALSRCSTRTGDAGSCNIYTTTVTSHSGNFTSLSGLVPSVALVARGSAATSISAASIDELLESMPSLVVTWPPLIPGVVGTLYNYRRDSFDMQLEFMFNGTIAFRYRRSRGPSAPLWSMVSDENYNLRALIGAYFSPVSGTANVSIPWELLDGGTEVRLEPLPGCSEHCSSILYTGQRRGECNFMTGTCACRHPATGNGCETCVSGFYGASCEPCPQVCQNNGTCSAVSGACNCPSGVTGSQCETICPDSTGQNGVCSPFSSALKPLCHRTGPAAGGYCNCSGYCVCFDGWTGDLCQLLTNDPFATETPVATDNISDLPQASSSFWISILVLLMLGCTCAAFCCVGIVWVHTAPNQRRPSKFRWRLYNYMRELRGDDRLPYPTQRIRSTPASSASAVILSQVWPVLEAEGAMVSDAVRNYSRVMPAEDLDKQSSERAAKESTPPPSSSKGSDAGESNDGVGAVYEPIICPSHDSNDDDRDPLSVPVAPVVLAKPLYDPNAPDTGTNNHIHVKMHIYPPSGTHWSGATVRERERAQIERARQLSQREDPGAFYPANTSRARRILGSARQRPGSAAGSRVQSAPATRGAPSPPVAEQAPSGSGDGGPTASATQMQETVSATPAPTE